MRVPLENTVALDESSDTNSQSERLEPTKREARRQIHKRDQTVCDLTSKDEDCLAFA